MSIAHEIICLIACHGAPADHFSAYAEVLTKNGYEVHLYKQEVKGLTEEEEDALARKIAEKCATAAVVITDVGHPFDVKLQKAIQGPRFAYYDNPEPFVPGGYSKVAAEVIQVAKGVLFANATLASAPIYQAPGKEVDLTGKNRIGIGYYPVHRGENIAERRKTEKESLRDLFLRRHQINDRGQPLWVYFGGNNEEYFAKAFPAFLSLLPSDDCTIIIQKHPGARDYEEKIINGWGASLPPIYFSDLSPDDAQVLADIVLYYQTSLSPQFILAGIPTIQIGHEPYQDIVVKHELAPSVTTKEELNKALEWLKESPQSSKEIIFESLGIRKDWETALHRAITLETAVQDAKAMQDFDS